MADSKTNTLASSGALPTEGNAQAPDHHAQAASPPTLHDSPSAIPGPGSLIDNKYRVENLIARGGMGVVYAATHTVSGKRVALKWMLPALGQIKGARERFMQEACATARIAHPNIVDIYDVGVGMEQGSAYLVMEYLRGETLADRMCRQRLSVADTIALLMPALRGVAAAHSHGVVHRDLKPENIFLCCTEHGEELEPKVLDFGISKITTDQVRDLALTHSGAVLGTPYYMSPEQVRGARDVDARADIYAIGVILFEALTGERPYDAETYNELILKIATEPMPNAAALNPDLDARLIAIVERAMAREPGERFQDVKQLALALEPFSGGVRFRSMQTLSTREAASGDFPIALDPTHADTRPAHPQSALSANQDAADSQLALKAVAAQRSTRLAVASAFVGLLACAGVAVYFLGHQATPPRAASKTPAAPSGSEPTQPVQDRSAITAAEAYDQARPPEHRQQFAAPSGVRPSPSSVQAQSPSPLAKPATPSSSNTKRSARASRLAANAPAPSAHAEPAPADARGLRSLPLPTDWDRRLDDSPTSPTSVHMPAGHINMNDFR